MNIYYEQLKHMNEDQLYRIMAHNKFSCEKDTLVHHACKALIKEKTIGKVKNE